VETTTIDAAVDSLLAPQSEGSEKISQETADEMIDQTGDDQSEIIDEVDDEIIEASDDEYEEDATEYTDEVEAVEDDNAESLFDVTINGRPERWTLSQLKQSAAGQGYIQQKMRENAEIRTQLAQQQEAVLSIYSQMQNGDFNQPKPPSKELLESDPIGYMQEKEAYETEMAEYSTKMQQLQAIKQQREQQAEERKALHRQEQMQLLKQRVPDFADPQRYEKAAQDMLRGGQEFYGVPQEALMSLTDAVEIEILYDAIRYRRMQANRKNVDAKAKKARPSVKSGSKRVQDSQAVTRKKQALQAAKSGNIRDYADLLLDPKL